MTELHILATVEDVAISAAEFVADLGLRCIRDQGRFSLALCGGSTPQGLYRRLADNPYRNFIEWRSWHMFWGDERCVPLDDPESNFGMVKRIWLNRITIPASQVHRMRGEIPPEEAALEYEALLRSHFLTPTPSFDLVLLGLGDDGHTASLFPETAALEEKHKLVAANWVPGLQAHRITFTLPLINGAKHVVFLDTDPDKAEVLRRVLEPDTKGNPLPAGLVRPRHGIVHWFLSEEAARQLTSTRS